MTTASSSDTPSDRGPHVTRRQFVAYTGVAGAAFVVGGAGGVLLTRIFPGGQTQFLTSYPRVKIAHLIDLQVGKPIAFDYPLQAQSSYLIQLGSPALDGIGPHGDIVAFSTLCVHMGCPLVGRYQKDLGVLGPCPCHLSTYDLSLGGKPVIGAATENLPQIELTVDTSGNIFAEGIWGLIYGFENNLQPGKPA
jgi:arsenite oxidase small subunit